ncbi:MAG: family 20 glycosylhydrolase [Aestuariibacter sp.]
MGNRCLLLISIIGFCFTSSAIATFTQNQLNTIAATLQTRYEVVSNLNVEGCEALFQSACFLSEITLTPEKGTTHPELQMYFSHIAPIAWDDSDIADIEHINGDLHRMTIAADAFAGGRSVSVKFKAKFWHASHSDIMPNYYLLAEGLEPQLIASTSPDTEQDTGLQTLPHLEPFAAKEQWRRGEGDNQALADSTWRYDYYQAVNPLPVSEVNNWHVLPQFTQSDFQANHVLSVAEGVVLKSDKYISNDLVMRLFPKPTKQPVPVSVSLTGKINTHYQIDISEQEIVIEASNAAAADYALLSLWQLLDEQQQLPVGRIIDTPRYEFRGLHLDLARNFMGKDQILAVIDEMFLVKLNKLHLHLADDEGWRLEIPQLPELTQVGAYRCHDLSETRCLLPQLGSGPHRSADVNGYLSGQDYLDILTYAKARHIDVIPSFDMPGHARAAVKAMEARYHRLVAVEQTAAAEEYLLSDFNDTTEYLSVQFYKDNTVNPCRESTYRFLETVIGQVQVLHSQAGMPLHTYHIGADETAGAWLKSPVCKAFIANTDSLNSIDDLKSYFLKRLARMVNEKGVLVAGWSDGMHALVDDPTFQGQQVNVWDALFWQGHKIADEFASQKWKTILSIPDATYFDFPYLNHPEETGYYWASKQTDTFKVFQIQPEHLANMSHYWQDRMGNAYEAQPTQQNRPEYAGIQAQIWTEAVRSNATVQYLLFPRLHAFAERAWHAANWEGQQRTAVIEAQLHADWQRFSQVLVDKHLPRLATNQPGFRLPPPGIKVVDGLVLANSLWPQLLLEYQDSEGNWHPYVEPVAKKQIRAVRSRLSGSDKVSRRVTF